MRAGVFILLCLSTLAQDLPVVRGVLVRRDIKTGELSLRAADDRVLRYRFDAQTYVERENRAIDAADLKAGEQLEVVSEAVPGAPLRAARSIHVLSLAPPRHHLPTPSLRAAAVEIEKGNLTFSGLILRVTPTRLVLHQREGGDQEILLRPDTRFADNGEVVAAASLKPNMRVFVRGARNDSGNVEAFQVVWGSMLEPK
ncbi:conserved exported hypothetical protein [Candidatus Sulfopaludibacter sp. SbA3]|nr:conserved exported hypothetical protein [Candidatus Sulfopaludibacter sp. SbA3]